MPSPTCFHPKEVADEDVTADNTLFRPDDTGHRLRIGWIEFSSPERHRPLAVGQDRQEVAAGRHVVDWLFTSERSNLIEDEDVTLEGAESSSRPPSWTRHLEPQDEAVRGCQL